MSRKPREVNPECWAGKSKISRLPFAIREQLNTKLLDGAKGREALKWLNNLPELKANGDRINAQNLTDWRKTGYSAWLDARQRKHEPPCQDCEKKDHDIAWYMKMLEMVVERFPKPEYGKKTLGDNS